VSGFGQTFFKDQLQQSSSSSLESSPQPAMVAELPTNLSPTSASVYRINTPLARLSADNSKSNSSSSNNLSLNATSVGIKGVYLDTREKNPSGATVVETSNLFSYMQTSKNGSIYDPKPETVYGLTS